MAAKTDYNAACRQQAYLDLLETENLQVAIRQPRFLAWPQTSRFQAEKTRFPVEVRLPTLNIREFIRKPIVHSWACTLTKNLQWC